MTELLQPVASPRADHAGKTLLIVGSVPGSRNVGQILLQEMLSLVRAEDYAIAALVDPSSDDVRDADTRWSLRMFACPPEHAVRRMGGRVGGLLLAGERVLDYEAAINKVSESVRNYAIEIGATRLWIILNSTAAIDVGVKLHSRMKLPVLTHVWDDVDHLTQQRELDALTRRRTARRFATLLAGSERTAVIGESMLANYQRRYGARCQIVRHGVDGDVSSHSASAPKEEYVIGFSGGMYCPSAWKAFLSALALLSWRIAGKPVRFVVMGGHVWFSTRVPTNIEYLGWRSDREVQARLANCDLLYLPQPFERSQRPLAELSFPTKLSAYVGSGVAVLVHGPEYASVVQFAGEHRVGPVCTQLDPQDLAKRITEFAEDRAAVLAAKDTVAFVAKEVLSRCSFARQVQAFLADRTDPLSQTAT